MKISICMITYNHEAYIAEAIESVLMQKTGIPYDLIIGEDRSTDSTREICEKYQAQYPEIITLLPDLGHNIGAMNNYIRTLKACDGEFLAILEGDDYWVHPQKLQMQVDFLMNHPDYVACFTDYDVIETGKASAKADDHIILLSSDRLSLTDLIQANQIMTCTILYRNKIRDYQLDWMTYLKMGDWPTHMIHAQYGDFKYLPVVTGTYRLHSSNYYAGRAFTERILAEQAVLFAIKAHLPVAYHSDIKQQLHSRYLLLAQFSRKQSNWAKAIYFRFKSLPQKSLSSWLKTLNKVISKVF